MAVDGWHFTARTGGGADDLDGTPGTSISGGDVAIVTEGDMFLFYEAETDTPTESDPFIIVPASTPGTIGWKLRQSSVRFRITPSGTSKTITSIEASLGTIFLNDGKTSQFTYTLPQGTATTYFTTTFIVTDAYYLRVDAYSGQYIRWEDTQTASGGYIRCNEVGGAVTLTWTGDDWNAMFHNGIAWSYDE